VKSDWFILDIPVSGGGVRCWRINNDFSCPIKSC
jgi:hypothetical protein